MKTVFKKIFSLMLVAVLLISAVPFQASAATIEVDLEIKLTDSVVYKLKKGVDCGEKAIKEHLPSGSTMLNEYKKLYSAGSEDMEFQGWVFASGVNSGKKVDTSKVLSADMSNGGVVTVVAQFGYPTKKITLDAKGGTVSPSTIEVKKMETYPELPTPTRSGYKFVGWFIDDNTQVGWGTPVNNYKNLYAKWDLGTYNVTFQDWSESKEDFVDSSYVYNVANGKSLNEHKKQNGFTLPEPGSFTKRNGYSISETTPWVDENGNGVNFDSKITRDMKIRPNYVGDEFTITYDFQCEELASETQKVRFGSKVTLKQPTRANYVFQGWKVAHDGKEMKTGDTYLYGNITLVAQWAKKGTVELRVYRDDADGFKTYYYSGAILGDELDLNNCNIKDYLSGTYEFDGWYDYNGWVSYLGTKSAMGVEAASNAVTRLEKVATSNTTNSTVTVIYGMVKGYKTTSGTGTGTGSGNSNGNSTNNATRDPSNPATGDYMITVATTTMLVSAAAVVLFLAMRKRTVR